MKYYLSAEYIERMLKASFKQTVIYVVLIFFFGVCSFLAQTEGSDQSGSLFAIAVTSAAAIGFGFFDARKIRGAVRQLSTLEVILSGEGVCIETPTDRTVIKYQAIQSVSIYRHFIKKKITNIVLHTEGVDDKFPGLDKPEEFIMEIKQHLEGVRFKEKLRVFT